MRGEELKETLREQLQAELPPHARRRAGAVPMRIC